MPNLPSVTSPLPRDLQLFVQRVREAIDGGGLDGLVTARQMVVAGIAGITNGTVTSAAASVIGTPTPPTGLAGSGALASVILTWNGPTYSGHAYTEVWAATQTAAQVTAGEAPVITQAVLIGMTAGNNFSHGIGSGATRYYWAKNVNRNGLASAFNATSGVSVTTGDDPEYLMDVLSSAIGGDSEAPFFQIDEATVVNGVSIPAGTYIKAAFIADATITNAKINSLTADKITASLLNTVDFYGNTIAGSTIYLGGTVTYTADAGGNNIGIASVDTPKIAMNSTGATFSVDAFKVDNPNGTNATPFSITDDVVEIDTALIKNASISLAQIDTANITNLSSIAVDAGTITAGVLKSSDNKFVIDLGNKTISIET
jgi:hypothetical protein